MSNNLLNNTASLQNILEALQNKAASGGSEPKTIAVTLSSSSSSSYVYYFNSSYELVQMNCGSTVDAWGGIIMFFGNMWLDVVSGNYIRYDPSITGIVKIIKFTANGGIVTVTSGSN